jgi:hypothetical protein
MARLFVLAKYSGFETQLPTFFLAIETLRFCPRVQALLHVIFNFFSSFSDQNGLLRSPSMIVDSSLSTKGSSSEGVTLDFFQSPRFSRFVAYQFTGLAPDIPERKQKILPPLLHILVLLRGGLGTR